MAKHRVIVLTSGGLNSAVAAAAAACDHEIALLHARFGHRAADRELELFEKQADHYQARHRLIVELPYLAQIGGSARVNRKKPIEDAVGLAEGETNCYVSGLVGTLAHVALNWATNIAADAIHLGTSENLGPPAPRTAAILPDYSREYLQLLQHAMAFASPYRRVSLEAPFLEMPRAEIIRLGHRLKVPFEITWSCISSGSRACGGCLGCVTRNRGFLDAGIPDPNLVRTDRPTPATRPEPAATNA